MSQHDHTSSLIGEAMRFLHSRLRGAKLWGMLVAVVLMLLAGWLTNVPAVLLGGIVDQLGAGTLSSFSDVGPILLLIAGAILGREILGLVRKLIVEGTATAIERDEFVSVIEHLLSVDLRSLATEQIGALQKKIDQSIEGVVRLIKLTFLDFFPTCIVAAVAMVMAGSRHLYILWLMLAVAVLGAVLTAIQVRSQKGIRRELLDAKAGISAKVVELLFGIEYVRASGARRSEVVSGAKLASNLRDKEYRHHKWMMSFDVVKQIIEGAGFVAVIALGAWLAVSGQVSKGDVLTFAILYMSVAAPVRELHRIIDEGFEATLKIENLRKIYELPLDVGLCGSTTLPLRSWRDSAPVINCENLSVKMPGTAGTSQDVLSGVTVEIMAGTTVGIAGPSGAGKSTFVKVLLGLISHYSGSARLCNVEIKELDKDSLASAIAYVPQTPFVIKGTVRSNATYGMNPDDFGDAQVLKALDRAQFHVLLDRLGGLGGAVFEMGRNLSGGERQRLVLARVLLKDAGIVVLDEATAALDTVNEALVQKAIEGIAGGSTTTLIIAHRLSTLRNVDRILVFDRGRIVQDGDYQRLTEVPGLFRELVEMQARDHRNR